MFAGIGHGLGLRLAFQAFVQRGDLGADVADLVNGVMRLRDPVADFQQQVKLFFHVLLGGFKPRIGLDLQRLRE